MSEASPELDIVWGVEAIARLINRSRRQTFHLVNAGEIPARKVGGRWMASRKKLVAFFESEAA